MPLREQRNTLSGRVWRIPGPEDAPTIPDLDAPPFVGRLLRRRGIENGAEGELFLECASAAPPSARDIMQPAVERILQAGRDAEPVAVYGDYDVDGITATVILHEALEQLGIDSRWFIPNRSADGYGLHDAQLERLAAEGAKLIITADCGITALDTLRRAQERLGLEFVVVDHHVPDATLPEVAALVAPHTEPGGHPFAQLSTGGLAWHLAQALMTAARFETPSERWLDLAALSAIADVVPLRGENRRIVHAGLRAMGPPREIHRPGLAALAALGSISQLNAEAVSFQLAPRINAAGRLDDASLAVELLLSETPAEAQQLAAQLDGLNRKRRKLSDQAYQRALAEVESLTAKTPNREPPLVLFTGDQQTHPGVVGIIAGRLVDQFERPAFAYSLRNGVAQASGRSPAPFDLAAMLAQCGDLLLRHGGHARAAAFSAETSNLPALFERLNHAAEAQLDAVAGPTPEPTLEIDGQVALDAISPDHVYWIERLQPFGAGNPPPLFLSTNVEVASVRPMGKDKSHLRLRLAPRHPNWRAPHWQAVAWRKANAPIRPHQRIDIAWTLRRDRANNVELEIQDLALPP